MDNYVKGEVRTAELRQPFGEAASGDCARLTVKRGSRIRNLVQFAASSLQASEEGRVVFVGVGDALLKTVSCVEMLKRQCKHLQLCQVTKVCYQRSEELWEPQVSGVDRLRVNVDVPAVFILVSRQSAADAPVAGALHCCADAVCRKSAAVMQADISLSPVLLPTAPDSPVATRVRSLLGEMRRAQAAGQSSLPQPLPTAAVFGCAAAAPSLGRRGRVASLSALHETFAATATTTSARRSADDARRQSLVATRAPFFTDGRRLTSADHCRPAFERLPQTQLCHSECSPAAPSKVPLRCARAAETTSSPEKRFASAHWAEMLDRTPSRELPDSGGSHEEAGQLRRYAGATGVSPPSGGRVGRAPWWQPAGQRAAPLLRAFSSDDAAASSEAPPRRRGERPASAVLSSASPIDGAAPPLSSAPSPYSIYAHRVASRRTASYLMATDDVADGASLKPSTSNESWTSSKAGSASATSQPSPPSLHQRLLGVFSSNSDLRGEDSVAYEQSRGVLEGPLDHRQVSLGLSHRAVSSDRGWDRRWAVLHKRSLRLYKQRPADVSGQTWRDPPPQQLDVRSSIVDIAHGVAAARRRRPHVLRLTTQQRTEHLLAVPTEDAMLHWIEQLQQHGRSAAADDVKMDANSMALIVERYEAQAQAASPSGRRRAKAEAADAQAHCSAQQSQSAPSAVTPRSGRKGKKVDKARSCPAGADGCRDVVSVPALGRRVQDCATSGADDKVPLLVKVCAQVIESHGMQSVGVYRIPGNTAAVNALTADLNKGLDHVDFSDSRWKDVNVVSSLLKAFLRELPEPLLTDKLYPIFIDANRIAEHNQRLRKIRHLVRKLPVSNHETLKYLIEHLRRVMSHSAVNKMEPRNLALMFGPSVVRPSGNSMHTMVTHMSDQCKLVESLIVYCDWVFHSQLDDEPPPPASSGRTDAADPPLATSFSDMNDLLVKFQPRLEEEEKPRDSLVRSLLSGRRGSKKNYEKAVAAAADDASRERRSARQAPPQRRATCDKPLVEPPTLDTVFLGNFSERNIDEEIANRAAVATAASDDVTVDAETHVSLDVHSTNGSAASPRPPDEMNEAQKKLDDMRQQRQRNMDSAKRVFMSGSTATGGHIGSAVGPADEAASSAEKLDCLAQHTRHLNLSGPSKHAQDILSPATREKIRRMQTSGELQPVPSAKCSAASVASAASSAPAGRERPWYDVDDCDDDAYVRLSVGARPRNGFSSAKVVPERAARDGLHVVGVIRTLSAHEKPTARISQKIRFKQALAQRRRDPRRHTLNDLEQIKALLQRSASDASSQASRRSSQKASKSAKLKSWFSKASFRKSSPDIRAVRDKLLL